MSERSSSRINFILDQLKNDPKLTAVELNDLLDARSMPGIKAQEKGAESESRVLLVLEQLSKIGLIRSFEQTRKYSGQDRFGLDIRVFSGVDLRNEGINKFWIQVKSSDEKVEEFFAKHDEKFFTSNRVIVINGQREYEDIAVDMLEQLTYLSQTLRQ